MRTQILFTITIFFLFGVLIKRTSTRSRNKADKLIGHICENFDDDGLYSEEDIKWKELCDKRTQSMDHQQQTDALIENMIDESYMTQNRQPRKSGSRSRGGGSRASSSSSRSSSSRVSNLFSRSRSSGINSASHTSAFGTRYQSARTGAIISRPTGWLWSRSRYIFLPLSTRYYHRSHSSYNRYSTSTMGSDTYYYCTSNSNASMEIRCSSINSDSQCCEDEATNQAFCCGGTITDDLIEDFSQATQILTRIFYTLSVLALCLHIFMRGFYR